ncbi:MAG: HAD hydrolase family protein [Patescibacteria group bacterium]
MEKHFAVTRTKLAEAVAKIKLFGLDYDGTVYNGIDYKVDEAIRLVEKILDKNKSIAFITGRAATALKTLGPPLQQLLKRKNIVTPVFISGGNGAILYEVKQDEMVEIYNHGFELPQIIHAVAAGRKVYQELGISRGDLSEEGLETFSNFLQEDWEGYIPVEILAVCRPYNGEIFTENAKVTFVLPKDKSLGKDITARVRIELGKEFVAISGKNFMEITKKFGEDGKATAIKTILKLTGLDNFQVATFGDMPGGNDIGLLSFPYSFTNSEEFLTTKNDLEKPPYLLHRLELSPIGRVHSAVEYLLKDV